MEMEGERRGDPAETSKMTSTVGPLRQVHLPRSVTSGAQPWRVRTPLQQRSKRNSAVLPLSVETADSDKQLVELERHMLKSARLEKEVQSVRASCSRIIANMELRCEQRGREIEQEKQIWFNTKQRELLEMKSSVKIMHTLFAKRRQALEEEIRQHVKERERMKVEHEDQKTRAQQQHAQEMSDQRLKHMKQISEREITIKDLEQKNADLTRERDSMKHEIKIVTDERNRLSSELDRLQNENAKLKTEVDTLQQSEFTKHMQQRIDELEEELKKVHRKHEIKNKRETRALLQEIENYVRFIVHVLPSDWERRLEANEHTEVRGRLKIASGLGTAQGQQGDSGDMSPRSDHAKIAGRTTLSEAVLHYS